MQWLQLPPHKVRNSPDQKHTFTDLTQMVIITANSPWFAATKYLTSSLDEWRKYPVTDVTRAGRHRVGSFRDTRNQQTGGVFKCKESLFDLLDIKWHSYMRNYSKQQYNNMTTAWLWKSTKSTGWLAPQEFPGYTAPIPNWRFAISKYFWSNLDKNILHQLITIKYTSETITKFHFSFKNENWKTVPTNVL